MRAVKTAAALVICLSASAVVAEEIHLVCSMDHGVDWDISFDNEIGVRKETNTYARGPKPEDKVTYTNTTSVTKYGYSYLSIGRDPNGNIVAEDTRIIDRNTGAIKSTSEGTLTGKLKFTGTCRKTEKKPVF